jgi:hypothetical protein
MKKHILLLVAITISLLSFSQEKSDSDWSTLDENDFSVDYPNSWQLNTSGKMNSVFFLHSEPETNDTFSENINLITQDLSQQKMSLTEFVDLSLDQVKTALPDSEIIKSEFKEKKGTQYYEVIWKGYVADNNLQFKQYLFMKDNNAYILTFTALQSTFDAYLPKVNKIFNSFKLKE